MSKTLDERLASLTCDLVEVGYDPSDPERLLRIARALLGYDPHAVEITGVSHQMGERTVVMYRADVRVVQTLTFVMRAGDPDRLEPDYRAAWREYYEAFGWVQGNRLLPSRYLGAFVGTIVNDLIDRAYPGLRDGSGPKVP